LRLFLIPELYPRPEEAAKPPSRRMRPISFVLILLDAALVAAPRDEEKG